MVTVARKKSIRGKKELSLQREGKMQNQAGGLSKKTRQKAPERRLPGKNRGKEEKKRHTSSS